MKRHDIKHSAAGADAQSSCGVLTGGCMGQYDAMQPAQRNNRRRKCRKAEQRITGCRCAGQGEHGDTAHRQEAQGSRAAQQVQMRTAAAGGCTGQYDASQPAKVTCHSSKVQDERPRSREAHSEASITICTGQRSAVGSVEHRHGARILCKSDHVRTACR